MILSNKRDQIFISKTKCNLRHEARVLSTIYELKHRIYASALSLKAFYTTVSRSVR